MVSRGKASRNSGHNYERKIAKEMRELGYKDCITTRLGSRLLDSQKVDLMNTDPFYIQCKAVESAIQYHKLLDEMPKTDNLNIVFHKRDKKEFVVMSKESFYALVRKIKEEK